MKKQILILTFFVAAILAGSNAFGQVDYSADMYLTAADETAVGCTPAVPLLCDTNEDALHPLPGETYTYGVEVTPAITTNANGGGIHWFVTDDPTVIDGLTGPNPILTTNIDADDGLGSYILDAEDAAYNDPTNTQATIDISWKSFDGATNQVLVVAYVTDDAGCTNNIEVYRIEPTFGFTLDIAGMFDDGTVPADPNAAFECVSPVEAATYDGSLLTVNYGENWIFYSVNAANWVDSWLLDAQASIANATSTLGTIQWAYPDEAFGATSTWNDLSVPIDASHYGASSVGADGECIVLRVQVDHGIDNEIDATDGAAIVTMEVNGTMYDPAAVAGSEYANATYDDLGEGGTGNPCTQIDWDDSADYTLTPRPAVDTDTEPGVADQPFEPKTGD
mgnify:CR=1 FL=1